MARERCNLDKDEAELLKPSSSPPPPPATSPPSSSSSSSSFSSSSPSPSPPPPTPQLVVTLKPPSGLEFQTQKQQRKPTAAAPFASSAEPLRQPSPSLANRCSSCRKRVGLTGFRCRCGDLFCPRHRYSDAHDCSFDYKAAGREQISKANPLIRPAKIVKI